MKQTYRKEIMSERENLKTYSIEFKKYTNSLNIEKSFKTPFILDMPDITSVNAAEAKTTQSAFTESLPAGTATQNTNIASNPASFFTKTQNDKSQTEKASIEKNATLIQKNSLTSEQEDTQTGKKSLNKNEKTQHTLLMNHTSISKLKTNPALKLESTHTNQPQTNQSKLTTSFMSKYSNEWKDTDFTVSKFKKVTSFSFALLIIGSFSIGGFWLYKNQNKSTDSSSTLIKPVSIKEAPKISDTQRAPTHVAQNKKIWIASNPSNASIYINNKHISKYTPYLLNINLNSDILITVRKRGFLPKNIQINENNFQHKIFIKLVKDNTVSEKTTHVIHQ